MFSLKFVSIWYILFLLTPNAIAVVNGEIHLAHEKPEVLRTFQFLHDPMDSIQAQNLHRFSRESESQCTAVAISHFQAITAGHCVLDEKGNPYQTWLLNWKEDQSWSALKALKFQSHYVYQDLSPEPLGKTTVPGCSKDIKVKVPLSKTKDLALLTFPAKTFSKWSKIGSPADVKIGSTLQIFGYGIHHDTTNSGNFISRTPKVDDLRSFTSKVKRMNSQRWAITAHAASSFAEAGDSGAPAFFNDRLVGLVSTVQPKCETEFGEDFEIMNSITKVYSRFPWLLEENDQSILLR